MGGWVGVGRLGFFYCCCLLLVCCLWFIGVVGVWLLIVLFVSLFYSIVLLWLFGCLIVTL